VLIADDEAETQAKLLELMAKLRNGTVGVEEIGNAKHTVAWLEAMLLEWLPNSAHASTADVTLANLADGRQ